tara:strand:+ start:11 stop:187 length:177 start_codon:yes stop_codon:yes gene_type:complete
LIIVFSIKEVLDKIHSINLNLQKKMGISPYNIVAKYLIFHTNLTLLYSISLLTAIAEV